MEISAKDASALSVIAQLVVAGEEQDKLEAEMLKTHLETDVAKKLAGEMLSSSAQARSSLAQVYINWAKRIRQKKAGVEA